jgi:hypothetical protein
MLPRFPPIPLIYVPDLIAVAVPDCFKGVIRPAASDTDVEDVVWIVLLEEGWDEGGNGGVGDADGGGV